MKSFWPAFLASLMALIVLIGGLLAALVIVLDKKEKIEDGSWLVVDLYGALPEYDPPGGVLGGVLGDSPETLTRVLGNLAMAGADERIAGVILKLSSNMGAGMAATQEIRGAVARLRAAGKPVYGYADSIDRDGFALAAACDSIFMPPTASIGFTGFGVTSTHVLGSLEKLGVRPNLHQIKDYKRAAELITRKDMSPAARRNIDWLLDDIWAETMAALLADRGLSESQVVGAMERAVLSPREAQERGFIDGVLYWDELEARLKTPRDERLRTVAMGRYADEDPKDFGLSGKKKIAVVHAQGSIGGRQSRVDPLLGTMMGHESVAADLRRAREDKKVAAIVFRIDSGGGESLASDLISRAVDITAREKPVVVSMVDVAGSGGYMIAYRATRLMADPLTITGSIGSISGKLNIAGLHEKLGISHTLVERGPNGLFWSDQRDFSPEQWARFTESHWEGFNEWLRDVADRRGIDFAAAESLAHGRVFTGNQAKANGLIDEVGDLEAAVALAKELAGLDAEERVSLVHYPEKKGLLESLLAGDADLAMAARAVLYSFIRDEAATTWRAVQSAPPRLEIN